MKLRYLVLALFVVTLGATYWIWSRTPSTFCQWKTKATSSWSSQLPDGASLERTNAVAEQVRDILEKTPGIETVGAISGLNFLTSGAQSNSAVEFAILKPVGRARARSARLAHRGGRGSAQADGHPHAFALSFDPPSIPGLGATGGFEFQVEGPSPARAARR